MSSFSISMVLSVIDRATAPVMQMSQAMSGGLRSIGAAAVEANKRMAKVGEISKSLTDAGKKISARVTLPMFEFGAAVLRAAGQFEASMNRVEVLSGATGEELSALTALARELGASTQFSASQAADTMSFLAMAGFKSNDILAALPGTLELAAAGQLDLAQAADIASNILSGYGLEAGEIGRVNDALAKTMTSANVNMVQLGEAMKHAAPVAKSAGLAFEETVAAIGLLGNAGIQGGMAGTALSAAMTRLVKPTSEAREAMGRLGIREADVLDSEGNIRSLASVIELLQSKGAATADMMAIFGQEAGGEMAALVGQGADALRHLTTEIENSGGTAGRIANGQMRGLNGSMKELASAFEGLGLAIGDAGILAWATDAVKGLTGVLFALSKSNPELLRWLTILALAAAAIAPVVMGLGTLGFALKGIVVGFAVVKAVALASSSAFVVLSTAMKGLAVGFAAIKGAAVAFGTALVTTPLGWFLAAIAAIAFAAFAIYKNWDGIVAYFTGKWDGVKAAFEDGLLGGIFKILTSFNPTVLLADAVNGMIDWLFGVDLKAVGAEWMGALGEGLLRAVPDLAGMLSAMMPERLRNWLGFGGDRVAQPTGAARPTMNPGMVGVAGSGVDVGGSIRLEVDDRRINVREVRSSNPAVGLEVDSGLMMAGGA